MTKFNSGKPYHGSNAVERGKLQGATCETDYFYFFCPKCPDKHILRILDYVVQTEETSPPYADSVKKRANRAFTLSFHLHCELCNFTDFIKISNGGWQEGTYAEIMARING